MVQYCSDVDGIPEERQYMYHQHISSKKRMGVWNDSRALSSMTIMSSITRLATVTETGEPIAVP